MHRFCHFTVLIKAGDRERGWVCPHFIFLPFFLGWVSGCWIISTKRETDLGIQPFVLGAPTPSPSLSWRLTSLVPGNFPPSSGCAPLSLAPSLLQGRPLPSACFPLHDSCERGYSQPPSTLRGAVLWAGSLPGPMWPFWEEWKSRTS